MVVESQYVCLASSRPGGGLTSRIGTFLATKSPLISHHLSQ